MTASHKRSIYIIAALLMLIGVHNLFIDIMQIDAAQYASIAREMADNGSYLEVYHREGDYLDKPPLLFWLASASIELFGPTNFGYKLPAFLVLLLGIFSTYKFTKNYYSEQTAQLAALILATTQGIFLVSHDVRTDGMLTSFCIFSVWQLSSYLRTGSWKHLIWGALGVALGMLTKGPIAIVFIGATLFPPLVFNGQWRKIFDYKWLVGIILVAIVLAPMTYGLYTQFDLHPEKHVYGLDGPSGIRFFYWTQSFGRITGEIYWNNNTGPFFFLGSILWDFMPWVLFFIIAFFGKGWDLLKRKFKDAPGTESYSFWGFLLVFVALSMSKFKLPHYIFPLFPFAAVITANYLLNKTNRLQRILLVVTYVVCFILFFAIGVDLLFFFPNGHYVLMAIGVIGLVLFIKQLFRMNDKWERLLPIFIAIVTFNCILSFDFYPNLLSYQSHSQAAKKYAETHKEGEKLMYFEAHGHTLDFYSNQLTQAISMEDICANKFPGAYIYMTAEGLDEMEARGCKEFDLIESYDDYKVTKLKAQFLNPKKRAEVVSKRYLIQLKKE